MGWGGVAPGPPAIFSPYKQGLSPTSELECKPVSNPLHKMTGATVYCNFRIHPNVLAISKSLVIKVTCGYVLEF